LKSKNQLKGIASLNYSALKEHLKKRKQIVAIKTQTSPLPETVWIPELANGIFKSKTSCWNKNTRWHTYHAA
jgi:hypothetical protein